MDTTYSELVTQSHDDVIKWEHFPRYWPFVRGIHRSSMNSPHKGQWCGALIFSMICVWINAWVNNREAGDLTRHHAHYDVVVMSVYAIIHTGLNIFWIDMYCEYLYIHGCMYWFFDRSIDVAYRVCIYIYFSTIPPEGDEGYDPVDDGQYMVYLCMVHCGQLDEPRASLVTPTESTYDFVNINS